MVKRAVGEVADGTLPLSRIGLSKLRVIERDQVLLTGGVLHRCQLLDF